jgi:TatD DNase family protein
MQLVDTHIHLYSAEFNDDRNLMTDAAIAKGISKFILPNIDSRSLQPLYNLCEAYPMHCFPLMGLHPCSVNENYQTELKAIESEFAKRKFYGIGEIGLDFYWDKTFIREQEKVFIRQLNLAHEMNLPVVIHSRESLDRILEIMHHHKQLHVRGIFHCFSGNEKQAEKIIGMGMYLGIGGVLTFKNSGLDKVMQNITVSHCVLETDAPYLAPAPYRGKRNLPEYLYLIAEKLAAVKQISVKEVAETTTANAYKIFNLSA